MEQPIDADAATKKSLMHAYQVSNCMLKLLKALSGPICVWIFCLLSSTLVELKALLNVNVVIEPELSTG